MARYAAATQQREREIGFRLSRVFFIESLAMRKPYENEDIRSHWKVNGQANTINSENRTLFMALRLTVNNTWPTKTYLYINVFNFAYDLILSK